MTALPVFGFDALRGLSQAATGSLAAAIWQGILLALAAALGLRLLPRITAHARFAIWFAVFLAVAALPAISFLPHRASAASAALAHPILILDARWTLAILALWAIASLLRAATLIVAVLRIRTLWKHAEPIDLTTAVRVPHSSHRDGWDVIGPHPAPLHTSERTAQLCVSDHVDRPSVIGFFAPKILIPRWLLDRLTPAELDQIVLHETSHLRRADDWLNLLQKLALVLFPLNPALLWLERRLCIERELACDEQVLRATGAPRAYAACLASLAEHRVAHRFARRSLALALGTLGRTAEPQPGPRSELGRRVHSILSFRDRMSAARARLVTGLAAAALVIAAGELSRSPQLVAFSDASPATQTAALIPPTHFDGSQLGGFTARDVVFHPTPVVFHTTPSRRTTTNPAGQSFVASSQRTGVPASFAGEVERVGYRASNPSTKSLNINGQLPTPNPPHETLLRAFAPNPDTQTPQSAHPTRAWLIVTTSWVGPDGSHLILTTATVSNSAPQASIPDAPNVDAAPDASNPAPDAAPIPQQVHPYAAVPVRGGWLVFQL